MNSNGNLWLKSGGAMSFAVALLHAAIIFGGAPAYRYFGAGEDMAKASEAGSVFPAALTLFLAGVFAVWGFYALSGAKIIRRLPFLRLILVLIGAIYTLRGLAVFQQIYQIYDSAVKPEPREIVFSSAALVIGLTYLIGTILSWKWLRKEQDLQGNKK